MVTGIAMPVWPLHVHDALGMGTVMVGLVTGAQFATALVSRVWAGNMGDARVALVCLLVEAAGQATIWLAPNPLIAFVGAVLTGFGYSLVYPGFYRGSSCGAAGKQRPCHWVLTRPSSISRLALAAYSRKRPCALNGYVE
jgi:MFS family permease